MSNNLIAYFSASEVTARLAKTLAKAVFLKSSQHKPDPIFYGNSNAVQGIIALSESRAEIKPKADMRETLNKSSEHKGKSEPPIYQELTSC